MGAVITVSAVIVTRGNVDVGEILESLPDHWEKVVWCNGKTLKGGAVGAILPLFSGDHDKSVYGRYEAIDYASGDVIYVQDDDCIVADPEAIVEGWLVPAWGRHDHVVCNMPPAFRHDFYQEHALVGFGAAFHRDAPKRAFDRFRAWEVDTKSEVSRKEFYDTCDIVFTGLTPRILTHVPHTNLDWATGDDRMYRQPEHQPVRQAMLERVREINRG